MAWHDDYTKAEIENLLTNMCSWIGEHLDDNYNWGNADREELVESKWETMEYPFTKEDALIWIIDLLYANCCFIELTTEEWDELIR